MKYYYALFKETSEAIEVEFPDLKGCVTFGKNREEAIENATDALAACFANAEEQFTQPPSEYEQLLNLKGELVPIAWDEQMLESY